MNKTRLDAIIELLDEMSTADLVALHNEYCYETNNYDDEIFDMDRFDEMCDGMKPTDIANSIWYGDFRPNDNYFCYNGLANFVSFDYDDDNNCPIYRKEIAEYIDENDDCLYNDEVKDLLDEWEEENEEESEEDDE